MAYWLLKTEPSTYSFGDLYRDKRATWDGVTNNAALIHMRAMKKGDLAFIYHSGDEKAIVGIAEIVSNPYSDHKGGDTRYVVVDLKPIEKLKNPVTLTAIKARREFSDFPLVRISRLSVMPVSFTRWKVLLAISD
jgi:predicted RNA-binding protein with PUA-like domain